MIKINKAVYAGGITIGACIASFAVGLIASKYDIGGQIVTCCVITAVFGFIAFAANFDEFQ